MFSALNGVWSSPVHFFSSEAPQPVTSLTSSGVTQNDATVEWTLHTDPFDQGYSTSLIYYLYMNDGHSSAYVEVFSSTSGRSYAMTGIAPGSTYKFKMQIQNNVGYLFSIFEHHGDSIRRTPWAPDPPTFVDTR